jgi:hypothetical protein
MLFGIGPGPLIVLMVLGSAVYYPWRHYDSWPAYAILVGVLVTLVWHLALILKRPTPDRLLYTLYAFVNLALYVGLGFVCLMAVTGDAL